MYDANINIKYPCSIKVLHHASLRASESLVQPLRAKGVEPSVEDEDGLTALTKASRKRSQADAIGDEDFEERCGRVVQLLKRPRSSLLN